MPLDTYNDLLAAVAAYVTYDDPSAYLDIAISQAEAVMNRDLRVREMQATESYSSNSSSVLALPADFIEVISFYENAEMGGTLERLSPNDFWSTSAGRGFVTGQPAVYTVLDESLHIAPAPDGPRDYVLQYYSELTPITPSNDSNPIYDRHPDVYVRAVLAQVYELVGDRDQYAEMQAAYERVRNSITQADARGRYRPGMRVQSRGVTRDGVYRIA